MEDETDVLARQDGVNEQVSDGRAGGVEDRDRAAAARRPMKPYHWVFLGLQGFASCLSGKTERHTYQNDRRYSSE
jgi:hypothetical protein